MKTDPAARALALSMGLGILLAGLAGGLAWKVRDGGPGEPTASDPRALLGDPEIRAQVVDELASESTGLFDSHPDPDVARVHLPRLKDGRFAGHPVVTNEWGMRERSYELPKREGTFRIVLLGDSVVFGHGVGAEDRMGVFLEEYLGERRGKNTPPTEVLHLGLNSWNAVSEVEFVRRQLGELRPDVVIQTLLGNDLDDTHGIRGWGSLAEIAPRRPEQCGRVSLTHPGRYKGAPPVNWLTLGLCHESRSRYRELARYTDRLADEVERAGGSYVLLSCFGYDKAHLREYLLEVHPPERLAFAPLQLVKDTTIQVSRANTHWNREGNELVARLLFGLIRSRDLLPAAKYEPWVEAEEQSAAWLRAGQDEVRGRIDVRVYKKKFTIPAALDFTNPDADDLRSRMRHVYAGIDPQGQVAPYGSLVLAGMDGAQPRPGKLTLQATCFDRTEIDGGRVEVFVEEHSVGTFELTAGKRHVLSLAVPAELATRPYVNVRFRADDWIYAGDERRDCVSFQLEKVAYHP